MAIKILPEVFASDPDRSARFALEARVLASLNHPNIGAIHGVEDEGGVPPWCSNWLRARRQVSGEGRQPQW